jgi:4-amino-4-deoxy-L-arabinose transferase-like glycosyltransferase
LLAERRTRFVALALVLLMALAWRLNNIGFGLPGLYDPDEPMFMLIPINMLRHGTINPGWFGHPGSTTIYLVALIDAAVAAIGLLSGHYANIADLAHAAYADPSLLFIPARTAMALIAVAAVWLTYVVGRRLHGTAVGLMAAALLATNALHIAWSQVVRTDIHASVFMLASIFFAIRVAERGRLRDYLLTGASAGLAIATKWPAAVVFIAVLGAFCSRGMPRRELAYVAAAAAAVVAAMFIASPYIFLDWRTVLANVSGEVQTGHLGHTGGTFVDNLVFYFGQVRLSMGWFGLALVLAGVVLTLFSKSFARWTLLPATAAFIVLICTQHMIWSRWILPAIPGLCIFAALAVAEAAKGLSSAMPRAKLRLVLPIVFAIAFTGSFTEALAGSAERSNDTRIRAARWAMAHIPPGSSVLLEHLELRFRTQPWHILFPVGDAGCIDAVKALQGDVRLADVQRLRGSSPIVDLGNVNPSRLDSCKADYAILTYYDLYAAEADRFPKQLQNYKHLLRGGKTVALFRQPPGVASGPTVRIVALVQR